MEERINFAKVSPGAVHHLLGLEKYLHDCGLEPSLLDLIKLRALSFGFHGGWVPDRL